MEQFDSSVEDSSRVSEQQLRNDEEQCPSCAAELTETSGTVLVSVSYALVSWSQIDPVFLKCNDF